MGIKVLSDVCSFGPTAFDVFLYSFDAGAPISPYHICGFHVCGGELCSSWVTFDPSFDRLMMTLVAGPGKMLQRHSLQISCPGFNPPFGVQAFGDDSTREIAEVDGASLCFGFFCCGLQFLYWALTFVCIEGPFLCFVLTFAFGSFLYFVLFF